MGQPPSFGEEKSICQSIRSIFLHFKPHIPELGINNYSAMTSSMSRKQKQQKLCEDLVKKCHFKKGEIECLLKEYTDIVGPSKPGGEPSRFDRNRFRDILHQDFKFTDDYIMDSVFRAFDTDSDSCISMEEWVKGLSVFLRGDLEEQAKFCFTVYDLNSDGYISREEIFHLLKSSLIKNMGGDDDPDEGIKDLVEIALKKMDLDNDHRLSFKDFMSSVEEDKLLLECLGTCLPQCECVRDYEQRLTR